MEKMEFKAIAITNEIDLNKIAVGCNIPKKYTWEEPLVLTGKVLSGILEKKVNEDQKIMIFAFGSIVFINSTTYTVTKFLQYLKLINPNIDIENQNAFSDDYELRVGEETEVTDEYIMVPKFEVYMPELIATSIAKSVALEKTEEQLGKILDTLEGMIDRLAKASLRVSSKEIALTTSKIIRHEYNTIAYIMILDKPDVTWSSSDAAEFYNDLEVFFELNDRYEILKKKTDILNNIMSGFSSISNHKSGMFVEWLIVVLIFAEIVLMVLELFK